MPVLPTSFLLGLRQMFDGAVLRILLKSAGVTILVFILAAFVGFQLLDWLLMRGGFDERLFSGAGSVRGVTSILLSLLGLWLTWRIVAMAVIQFYADEIVAAVERRHYPDAASSAREMPLAEQVKNAARGAGRALIANLIAAPFALALLFTGIGTAALFWLVNAVLLGRELQDMVWLRHQGTPDQACPVSAGERFLLGGAIAGLLLVPFAHFLAPVLGAASATHLVHRKPDFLPSSMAEPDD